MPLRQASSKRSGQTEPRSFSPSCPFPNADFSGSPSACCVISVSQPWWTGRPTAAGTAGCPVLVRPGCRPWSMRSWCARRRSNGRYPRLGDPGGLTSGGAAPPRTSSPGRWGKRGHDPPRQREACRASALSKSGFGVVVDTRRRKCAAKPSSVADSSAPPSVALWPVPPWSGLPQRAKRKTVAVAAPMAKWVPRVTGLCRLRVQQWLMDPAPTAGSQSLVHLARLSGYRRDAASGDKPRIDENLCLPGPGPPAARRHAEAAVPSRRMTSRPRSDTSEPRS